MKLPFWLTWSKYSLKGKAFDIAKANHELKGEELERTLLNIEFPDYQVRHTDNGYRLADLELRKRYNHISDREYDFSKLTLESTEADKETLEYKTDFLELKKKYHEITELGYSKELATLNEEPWVNILDSAINYNSEGSGLEINLDWNVFFIEELVKNGYSGATEPEIVDEWFNAVCKDIFAREFMEDEMNGSLITKTRTDNGSEYS